MSRFTGCILALLMHDIASFVTAKSFLSVKGRDGVEKRVTRTYGPNQFENKSVAMRIIKCKHICFAIEDMFSSCLSCS